MPKNQIEQIHECIFHHSNPLGEVMRTNSKLGYAPAHAFVHAKASVPLRKTLQNQAVAQRGTPPMVTGNCWGSSKLKKRQLYGGTSRSLWARRWVRRRKHNTFDLPNTIGGHWLLSYVGDEWVVNSFLDCNVQLPGTRRWTLVQHAGGWFEPKHARTSLVHSLLAWPIPIKQLPGWGSESMFWIVLLTCWVLLSSPIISATEVLINEGKWSVG